VRQFVFANTHLSSIDESFITDQKSTPSIFDLLKSAKTVSSWAARSFLPRLPIIECSQPPQHFGLDLNSDTTAVS
jgi:hypothetical protein